MVKYTTALRLGTAETEAILRRFTRDNVQHPTYKALVALGKACRTIFLCRYLRLAHFTSRDSRGAQYRGELK
jgi:TnpA family transposase